MAHRKKMSDTIFPTEDLARLTSKRGNKFEVDAGDLSPLTPGDISSGLEDVRVIFMMKSNGTIWTSLHDLLQHKKQQLISSKSIRPRRSSTKARHLSASASATQADDDDDDDFDQEDVDEDDVDYAESADIRGIKDSRSGDAGDMISDDDDLDDGGDDDDDDDDGEYYPSDDDAADDSDYEVPTKRRFQNTNGKFGGSASSSQSTISTRSALNSTKLETDKTATMASQGDHHTVEKAQNNVDNVIIPETTVDAYVELAAKLCKTTPGTLGQGTYVPSEASAQDVEMMYGANSNITQEINDVKQSAADNLMSVALTQLLPSTSATSTQPELTHKCAYCPERYFFSENDKHFHEQCHTESSDNSYHCRYCDNITQKWESTVQHLLTHNEKWEELKQYNFMTNISVVVKQRTLGGDVTGIWGKLLGSWSVKPGSENHPVASLGESKESLHSDANAMETKMSQDQHKDTNYHDSPLESADQSCPQDNTEHKHADDMQMTNANLNPVCVANQSEDVTNTPTVLPPAVENKSNSWMQYLGASVQKEEIVEDYDVLYQEASYRDMLPRKAVKRKSKSNRHVPKRQTYEFKCRYCPQRYYDTQNEVDFHESCHIVRDGKVLPDAFKCKFCEIEKSAWHTLSKHLLTHKDKIDELEQFNFFKSQIGEFRCDKCGKMFRIKSNLFDHKTCAHGEKTVICDICGKILRTNDSKTIKRHMDRCRKIMYKCKYCDYQTIIRCNLAIHNRIHQGKGVSCHICQKVFATKSALEKHKQSHEESRVQFICEYCGQNLSTQASLQMHIKRLHMYNTDFYKCNLCSFTTVIKSSLPHHIEKVHNKKYKCQQCVFQTNSEQAFITHTEYHSPEKIFPCPYDKCYFRSATEWELHTHQQEVHLINSPHQCFICGKFFRKKSVMSRHIVSHTGMEAYKCVECGKKFRTHSSYYRHKKKTGHDANRKGVASVPSDLIQEVVQGMHTQTNLVMSLNT